MGRPRVEPVVLSCACGRSFSVQPADLRKRERRGKGGALYCSRACGTRYWHKQQRGNSGYHEEATDGDAAGGDRAALGSGSGVFEADVCSGGSSGGGGAVE
jgi:hypothetical protein